MNKLFEWLDQIETIIYAIAEFDAGDMSTGDKTKCIKEEQLQKDR